MASSSHNPSAKYDVFISFRGEDVRHGFLSHLKTKLNQKDINAFVDDRLETGEKISPALLRAIEKSNSSLVIFSENYASSTWCLDELVKIIECMNEKEHIVIPVFLEIDPSIVRHQKGSYKDAFDQHKKRHNKEMMQLWRSALIEAASISGIHYSESSSLSPKDEAALVEKIAEVLFRKLKGDSSTTSNIDDKYDNAIRELSSIKIGDDNDDDSVYQDLSSWEQKKINFQKRFQERRQHHFNVWLNLQKEKQFGGNYDSSTSDSDEYDDAYANEELMSFNEYYRNYDVSDVDDYYGDSSSLGQKKNKNRKKNTWTHHSMNANYGPQPQYSHYDSGYSPYQADMTIPTMTTSCITTPTTQVRISSQFSGPHIPMPPHMHGMGRRWTK